MVVERLDHHCGDDFAYTRKPTVAADMQRTLSLLADVFECDLIYQIVALTRRLLRCIMMDFDNSVNEIQICERCFLVMAIFYVRQKAT